MITKGFIMFYGGIAGFLLTLVIGTIMIIVGSRKKKSMEEDPFEEPVSRTEVNEAGGLEKSGMQNKSVPDTVLNATETINTAKTVIAETEVMQRINDTEIMNSLNDTEVMK